VGGGTPQWLSTHPDPGNRVADMTASIAELPPEQRQGTVGREAYLRRLEGMVFGDDPRQGYAIGNTFYHPVLAFKDRVPRPVANHQPAPAGRRLSPNQDAVVVLSMSDKETPNAGFDAFFGQQGIERGPSRGRNLMAFRALDSQSGSPVIEGLIGYLSHGRQLYQLIGYTKIATWDAYSSVMQRSLTSFAKVSDRRYLEVEPSTIDVVELPRAMTLAEFAERFPSTVELDQLALINGVTAQTRLEKGQLVKRVVGGELPKK
jgi:predicted Zn-dependent protease